LVVPPDMAARLRIRKTHGLTSRPRFPQERDQGDQVKTAVIVCFSWWLAAKAALVR